MLRLHRVMCLALTLMMLLPLSLPVSAMGRESHVQLVHITQGSSFDTQTTVYYSTVEEAFKNAADGDVIEVFDGVTVSASIVVPADIELTVVSGTKRETTAIFGRSAFEMTDENAVRQTVKKDFDGSLFVLGENSGVTFENITLDGGGKGGEKGGLIYAQGGASLTLRRGVVLENAKLAQNSFGGAIYAEKSAAVSVEDTVFSDNDAAVGKDIYAEQKTDVSVASGITADFAFPKEGGVDISGLNLILTGEIGLTFHTEVPENYLDGTFVMTSRTGETVTLNIADCYKDSLGRYMAKYNLSSSELSEPVTLTVYDRAGSPLAAKTKSAEDYGKWLLTGSDCTDGEKDAIRALLNYGHYAQIESAEYEGWEIGKDYAETAKYADLTTDDSAFDSYTYRWTGSDPEVPEMAMQLELGYKTDIIIHFPTASEPVVLVNGEAAEIEQSELENYNYCIRIRGINALDLAGELTVEVNGRITLTLSAMSYCKLVIEQNGENCKNAVKALYEFYLAVVKLNKN